MFCTYFSSLTAVLAPFVIACALYLFIFLLFKRFAKHPLAQQIFKVCHKALLTILLILAALVALKNITWPDKVEPTLMHGLVIALIATIGVSVAFIVKSIYSYVRAVHASAALEDFSRRSFVTQMQILYRASMFAIGALTAGAILMTFPMIKSFGIGILGSAGIVGIALGLAARPVLQNFIAGFQIAFTNMLRIGDMVVVEGEQGRVEHIFLTHVIVKLWDYRRMVLPISYFIDKPYQNWSTFSTELFGITNLFCDYKTPVDLLRKKFEEILNASPLWNKKVKKMEVIDMTENAMKVRFLMTAASPQDASDLQSLVREKLIEFLQKEHPYALPKLRYEEEK
jgi:small-conductance mechanosensitive channel